MTPESVRMNPKERADLRDDLLFGLRNTPGNTIFKRCVVALDVLESLGDQYNALQDERDALRLENEGLRKREALTKDDTARLEWVMKFNGHQEIVQGGGRFTVQMKLWTRASIDAAMKEGK